MSEGPTVILVMGSTGAGKSTFINIATEEDKAAVDKSSLSGPCTKYYSAFTSEKISGVQLLDMPGFTKRYPENEDEVKELVSWIKKSYKALNGVIYLYDVSCREFPIANVQQNLNLFKYHCGNFPIGKTALVTTKWDRVDKQEARQEEVEKVHWKPLVQAGSMIFHFNREPSSAISIVGTITSAKNDTDQSSEHLVNVSVYVMGEIKSGKSTFINSLLTQSESHMEVRDTLSPCTTDFREAVVHIDRQDLSGYRFILIDTPGFGWDSKTDIKILQRLDESLKFHQTARRGRIFGGVIYLHDISEDRLSATASERIQYLFKHATPQRVIFGTTKWERALRNNDDVARREGELNHAMWRGCQSAPFRGTRDSALTFLHLIKDIVDKEQKLPDENQAAVKFWIETTRRKILEVIYLIGLKVF